jgi:thioredoxin reductase/protein-L-isoaspartate O-methyltransferase
MTEHGSRLIERHCDVAVIGGSAAGLAAALQLGRQRRSVIVIDAGEPRNASAAHVHSYLGHEGLPPAKLAAIGREEVRSFGVEVLAGRAVDVTRLADDRFRVELIGGGAVVARRVLAATGLIDVLPDIEGVAEHWGGDVIHCPFCHGYEVRDQRMVQIVTHPMALHQAGLFRQLTARLTMVLHEGVADGDPGLDELRAAGVTIVDGPVRRVVSGSDGHVTGVELANGRLIDADAVVVGSQFRGRAEAFTSLSLFPAPHSTGLGDFVETDPTGETSVPGLYAAGNLTDPSQQVLQAAANGSRVGAMISFSLVRDDVAAAARPSANEADWDHRYGEAQIWSGNPNGTLVTEIDGMEPGQALDVGAGEGGDAVWLAQHGWRVTASDISQRALDRITDVARQRDLPIECHHADANSLDAYPENSFDLVSAHYASIPRTPDRRGIYNLLTAVRIGGTLLVVGHDLEPMRRPIDTTNHSRQFDPDAYVRVDDFIEVITDSAGWQIEVDEKRPRLPGAVSASHHIDDVVLRARRVG